MRVIGNLLIVVLTLAVGAMVVLLVLDPRGAVGADAEGQDIGAIPTTAPTTPPPTTTPTPTPTPPPPMSLAGACGALLPMLERGEEVRFDYVNNKDDLEPGVVSAVTTDLQSIRDLAPSELATTIDPLLTVMNAFTLSLTGSDNPVLDLDAATASEDAIQEQCIQ